MQIVIDISKQDYVYIVKKHCLPSCDDKTLRKIFYEMISSGTPLPKSHGRLIDEDVAISKICGHSCGCNLEECGYDNPCNSVTMINSVPTIIEAESEEE